ncbi:hypothetical protein M9Y10_038514 [Tritrichomonas musculus]|uniref:Major facilitator superfamily transporter n=1 Tax=Tritrichomonas musculus TaxID=1915356 RepID=A0ABR2K8U1_9EUKA
MGNLNNFITRVCEKSPIIFNIIAVLAGFLCYFSTYGFRKPFVAGTYEGYSLWGVQFKILGITVQIIGYTISKFLGIKVISEIKPKFRGIFIISFLTFSEVVLITFGAIPRPYNCLVMFFNGLPLGMIWGLIFSYLEGRKSTALLGSLISISLIVASGAIKSICRTFLDKGFNQFWVPATVGAICYVPMILSVLVLESLPPPNAEDIASKTERVVMNNKDRLKLCQTFAPGLFLMIFWHMFLTAYRDFRDNFAPELWEAFGYGGTPSIFSISEIIVAFVVCIPISLFMFIKKPITTLISYHVLIIGGQILIGLCAILNAFNILPGLYFMIMAGIGLYFGYIPFNSIIFDTFIATYKYPANTGFLSYLSDSIGYLSSVVVLFIKNFASANLSWLDFFRILSYIMAASSVLFLSLSIVYCIWKYKHWDPLANVQNENSEDGMIKIKKLKDGEQDENDETRTTTNEITEDNDDEGVDNIDDDVDEIESVSMSSQSEGQDPEKESI